MKLPHNGIAHSLATDHRNSEDLFLAINRRGVLTSNKEEEAPQNGGENLLGDNEKKKQRDVFNKIKDICDYWQIPICKAHEATKILLGKEYIPELGVPDTAPKIWSEREPGDPDNPITFFEIFWKKYRENGVITQSDLRRLDNSLFVAIKSYCRNRGLDPLDYLPPPAREKQKPARPARAGRIAGRKLASQILDHHP